MLNKIKQIGKYILYILLTNTIYGLILYFVCTWLAGYSLLYAFLANLALIVLGLAIDEYIIRMFQSEKVLREIKKETEKDKGKSYRYMQWFLDNFVSFKTVLYLFYIFLLIASQIVEFNNTLISEDLGTFIITTRYSILLLVAFDMLISQFSKNKEKMNKIAVDFKKYFTEKQD